MATIDNPYLSAEHVESMMRAYLKMQVEVRNVECYNIDNSASILVSLTSQSSEALIGHFGLRVNFLVDGEEIARNMVLKIKPNGREIANMLAGLANLSDPELGKVYSQFSDRTGFYNTHMREIEVYRHLPHSIQPKIFGLQEIPLSNAFLILMEDLSGADLLNTAMEPVAWTKGHIKKALKSLAGWHAHAKDKRDRLDSQYWLDTASPDYLWELEPLWTELVDKAYKRFPDFFSEELFEKLDEGLQHLKACVKELEAMPKTLIHNDCNPRNSCFVDGDFVLYDWELATWHVPQYDLVEFICFLNDGSGRQDYIDYYRKELAQHWDFWANKAMFDRGLKLAALHFGLHRLGMYLMAHAVAPYPFLPRVVKNYADLMRDFQYN